MNEFELIKRVTQGAPKSGDGLVLGVGDDCAVIERANGKDLLITTDALFEGIHFRREWTTFRTLGRKALNVNVSDIAAMGGKPLYYLVNIGIPKGFSLSDVETIFDGMAHTAAVHRMSLIGGDTCGSDNGLLLSITVIGEAEHGKSIYRSGAGIGDAVYVTGTLGGSALGLACLEKGLRGIDARPFIKRHDDPSARVIAGQWFAASACVSAMIDVSDGLAADLGHIAESSVVGIELNASNLPLADGYVEAANQCHKDPLMLALTGGEDYELAFTVSCGKKDLFEKMLKVVEPTFGHRVTKIGEVTKGNGVRVFDIHGTNVNLQNAGFEHKF